MNGAGRTCSPPSTFSNAGAPPAIPFTSSCSKGGFGPGWWPTSSRPKCRATTDPPRSSGTPSLHGPMRSGPIAATRPWAPLRSISPPRSPVCRKRRRKSCRFSSSATASSSRSSRPSWQRLGRSGSRSGRRSRTTRRRPSCGIGFGPCRRTPFASSSSVRSAIRSFRTTRVC